MCFRTYSVCQQINQVQSSYSMLVCGCLADYRCRWSRNRKGQIENNVGIWNVQPRDLSYFLGMEFKDTSEWVLLHQKKYTQDILKRFKMSKCNAVVTSLDTGAKFRKDTNEEFVSATLYKQITGSLRYICNTRPNIC